jgi:hypothetical protein
MNHRKPPPALTLREFYALPTRTRLEVYVQGTGLWTPARVFHQDTHSTVTPDDSDLAVRHEVIMLDEMPDYLKEAKLRLVRRPHPKGHMVEPGSYRDLLERFCIDLVALVRSRTEVGDAPSFNLTHMRATLRHMLSSGFTADLWSVMDAVVHQSFAPEADDPLFRILEDINRG